MMSSFIALSAALLGGLQPAASPVPPPAPAAIVAEAPRTPASLPVAAGPEPAPVAPAITEPAAPASALPPRQSPPLREVEAPRTQEAPSRTAQSAPDPSIVSPTERRAILQGASDALSRVETAQGEFRQIDPQGGVSTGEFALQRPGRMRFDYDDPVPILIAADGTNVAMRDEELETVDRVPLASTPLGLLLDDSLDFETEAEVLRVQREAGVTAITVVDPSEDTEGELTLLFDSASYELLGWQVLDANGGITRVELSNVHTGMSLNPRLFIIRDFEEEDDRRRR